MYIPTVSEDLYQRRIEILAQINELRSELRNIKAELSRERMRNNRNARIQDSLADLDPAETQATIAWWQPKLATGLVYPDEPETLWASSHTTATLRTDWFRSTAALVPRPGRAGDYAEVFSRRLRLVLGPHQRRGRRKFRWEPSYPVVTFAPLAACRAYWRALLASSGLPTDALPWATEDEAQPEQPAERPRSRFVPSDDPL